MVHINTLPETKYAWEDWVKRVHPPAPQHLSERFAPELRPGSKPTRIDLTYKVGWLCCWRVGAGVSVCAKAEVWHRSGARA